VTNHRILPLRFCSFALILAFGLNLSAFSQKPTVDTKTADEQNILAAVIRRQMEEWVRSSDKGEAEAKNKIEREVAGGLNFKVFFISLNGKDPTDEFVNRFRDIPRSIRKISSEMQGKGPHTPHDRTTGIAGIVFSADKIHWVTKDSAEVEGGYYCGGLCAGGYTFTVERKDGQWAVKCSEMFRIS
jgi:hypothetical protein